MPQAFDMNVSYLDAEVRRLRFALERAQETINAKDDIIRNLTAEIEEMRSAKPGLKQAISETLHLKGKRGAI